MKRVFDPPIVEPVDESGLELYLKGASSSRGGTELAAQIEVWNGSLVHAGRVDLASDLARKRFVKTVSDAHPSTDAGRLSSCLLLLCTQIPDLLRQELRAGAATGTIDPSATQHAATGLLEADDPLRLIAHAIRRLGYGGDLKPPLIVELAVTSRLLAMRPGAMPVHLLLIGPPSAGKSYTLGTILRLHPPDAAHVIDAGSPRVLLYDEAPLKHRALVFSEADSLPAGEDNPAASAVRALLQEHQVTYRVTVLNPETNRYEVQDVVKEGPTVLITTAVHQLGEQLSSRLFALDVPYELSQLQATLTTQASIELNGAPTPDPAVIAYHAFLQSRAPWDVTVPFAAELAALIGKSASAPRINRDFARLLSLIKAAAILRHQARTRDARGRLVAAIADYDTVFNLVDTMYASAVTGVTPAVRSVVQGVADLKGEGVTVTVTKLADHLSMSKMAASRATRSAMRYGWLANAEHRKGYPADFAVGEPIPAHTGLPHPDALSAQWGCNAVTTTTVSGAGDFSSEPAGSSVEPQNSLAPLTVKSVTALQPSPRAAGSIDSEMATWTR